MIGDFIYGKIDENVITIATFIIELTIDKIVVFELFEQLFYLLLYSLTLGIHIINHYTQKWSLLVASDLEMIIANNYDKISTKIDKKYGLY